MEAYAINDWDELEAKYFGDYEEPEWIEVQKVTLNRASAVSSRSASESARRARKTKEIKRKNEMIQQIKKHERYVSHKRFREAVLAVIGIALVAAVFSVVLYRQSQITLQNYQNNEMVTEINALQERTSQIREDLVISTDFEQVRWDAMERLGMQTPSVRQVITIEMPGKDQLVTNDFEVSSANSKIGLAAAKENLAQYYSELM